MALGQSRTRHSVPTLVTLLLTLFAIAGVFVIFEGSREISHRAVLQGVIVAAFGSLFLSIPAVMLALLIYGRREERRRAERRAANPDHPWTWRQDFSSGILNPQRDPLTAFAAVFSLFWTAGALAGAWAGIREFQQTGRRLFLIALVFPAVGAVLLLWAATRMRRWMWYRRSVLRLEATPVEIGGTLKGTIVIPRLLHPGDGFELTLECVRRSCDADGDAHDSVLWQERARVATPMPLHSEVETGIPVSMPIPGDCESWNDDLPDRKVLWFLRLQANILGAPSLQQVFEVPVFRTRPEDPGKRRELLPDGFIRPPARTIAPAASRVRIEPSNEGLEFVFPHPGGWKSILGFVIAFSVTAGTAWGLSMMGAPWIFPAARLVSLG